LNEIHGRDVRGPMKCERAAAGLAGKEATMTAVASNPVSLLDGLEKSSAVDIEAAKKEYLLILSRQSNPNSGDVEALRDIMRVLDIKPDAVKRDAKVLTEFLRLVGELLTHDGAYNDQVLEAQNKNAASRFDALLQAREALRKAEEDYTFFIGEVQGAIRLRESYARELHEISVNNPRLFSHQSATWMLSKSHGGCYDLMSTMEQVATAVTELPQMPAGIGPKETIEQVELAIADNDAKKKAFHADVRARGIDLHDTTQVSKRREARAFEERDADLRHRLKTLKALVPPKPIATNETTPGQSAGDGGKVQSSPSEQSTPANSNDVAAHIAAEIKRIGSMLEGLEVEGTQFDADIKRRKIDLKNVANVKDREKADSLKQRYKQLTEEMTRLREQHPKMFVN
jgi:hypothetical protein